MNLAHLLRKQTHFILQFTHWIIINTNNSNISNKIKL